MKDRNFTSVNLMSLDSFQDSKTDNWSLSDWSVGNSDDVTWSVRAGVSATGGIWSGGAGLCAMLMISMQKPMAGKLMERRPWVN